MGMDLVDQHYVQRGYLLGDQTGGQMNDGNITCDTCGGVFSAVRQMRGHACSGNPTPQQPGPREFWLCDMRGPDAIARADEWNQNMEVFVVKPKFSDVIHVREVTPGPFREFALYPTGNGGWRSVLNDERTQAYGNVVYTVERSALTACEAKLAEALATSEHRYKWAMAVQAKWGSAEAQLQAERERADRTDDSLAVTLKRVREERDAARSDANNYKQQAFTANELLAAARADLAGVHTGTRLAVLDGLEQELRAARAEVTRLRELLFKQTSEKILTKFAGLFKKLRDGGD